MVESLQSLVIFYRSLSILLGHSSLAQSVSLNLLNLNAHKVPLIQLYPKFRPDLASKVVEYDRRRRKRGRHEAKD